MKIKRVVHIGVTAETMDPVKNLYSEVLGLPIGREELYDNSEDICFFPVGDSSIEIFADNPETGKGNVGKCIEEQGGTGVHHIALEVDNIHNAIEELQGKGFSIREGDPRLGAGGTIVAFLNKAETYGVLIELVEVTDQSI